MRRFFKVIVAFAAALMGMVVYMAPAAAQEETDVPGYDATLEADCSADSVTVAVTASNTTEADVFVAVSTAPNKGAGGLLAAGSSETYVFVEQARRGAAIVEFSETEDVNETTSFGTSRLTWECEEETPPAPPVAEPHSGPDVIVPPAPPEPPAQVLGTAVVRPRSELPQTGSSSALLTIGAIIMIGLGLSMRVGAKRYRLRNS